MTPTPPPIPLRAIEQLFLRFGVRYQRAWTALLPTPAAYRVACNEWALALAGVEAAGIERALQRCLSAFPTYPPKPGEFLALTRPTAADLGLPDLETAYRAALAQDWRRQPLAWHCVAVIGAYHFRRLPESEARRCFTAVYQRLLAEAAQGRQFRLPASGGPLLPAPRSVPVAAPGTARAHLQHLRRLLRGGPPHTPTTDCRSGEASCPHPASDR